jgi:phosphoribosylpyrophosphate synthetase
MTDLLDMLYAGRRNVEALSDPQVLVAVASQIGAFASSQGITNVCAASAAAERIVGAALVMLSQRQDGLVAGTVQSEAVLLVDVNLASGTVLAEAAERARERGACQVQGLVLHALSSTVGPHECGLDGLQVLGQDPALR